MKFHKDSLKTILKNNTNIITNILYAFLVKGGSMILAFFLLPAYIRFFGRQSVLGVWFTILSIINWVLVFDLGIGNGLRNKLPKALVLNDDLSAKKLVSSTYCSSIIVVIGIGFFGNIAINMINWNNLLNISESDLSPSVLKCSLQIVFTGVLVQFVLKLITSILYAIQKSGLVDLLTLISNLIIFAVINLLPPVDVESSIITISIINVLAVNIPLIAASIVLFCGKLRAIRPSFRYWDKDSTKNVLKIGVTLLWLQLVFMVISSTNEFLISVFCKPADVVDYQVYFKIFNSVAAIFSLILIPIWSAVTKAQIEKKYQWIKRAYKFLLCFSVFALLVLFLMTIVLQPIVDLWLKEETIAVNFYYAILFALSGYVFLIHNINTSFGNGMSYFKPQLILMTLAAVLDIPMVWLLIKLTGGMIGAVLANIIVLLPFEIIEPFMFFRYINKISVTKYNTHSSSE